jgi:small subunit ribosomal protein S8
MAMTDPIGDMLTRIRNAQMRNKTTVVAPASKLRERVLQVLADEGYIRGFHGPSLATANPKSASS